MQYDWKEGFDLMLGYFQHLMDQRQPKRKPVWALRLLGEGGESAIFKPDWIKRKRTIADDVLCVEYWEKRACADDWRVPYHKCSFELKRVDYPRSVHPKTWSLTRDKVKQILLDFANDPMGTMARSRESCCICGKRLTDEKSRVRGIGPECLKTCRFFVDLRDDSPSMDSQALEDEARGEPYTFTGMSLGTAGDKTLFIDRQGCFILYDTAKKQSKLCTFVDLEREFQNSDLKSQGEMLCLFLSAGKKYPKLTGIVHRNSFVYQEAFDYIPQMSV